MTTSREPRSPRLSRRGFLGITGGSAAALLLGPSGALARTDLVPRPRVNPAAGCGELVRDPGGGAEPAKGLLVPDYLSGGR